MPGSNPSSFAASRIASLIICLYAHTLSQPNNQKSNTIIQKEINHVIIFASISAVSCENIIIFLEFLTPALLRLQEKKHAHIAGQ